MSPLMRRRLCAQRDSYITTGLSRWWFTLSEYEETAMRKGYYFSLDAVLAASLLLLGIFLASNFYVQEQTVSTNYIPRDIVGVLNSLRVGTANNSYINGLIANGIIADSNISLLEQVGAL